MSQASERSFPGGIALSKLARADARTDVFVLSAKSRLLSRHLSGGYVSVGSRSRFARPLRLSTKERQGSNKDEVSDIQILLHYIT